MGGYAPLGYDVANRKLVPNDAETELVRRIFNRFIRLGSTTLLCKELNDQGFRSKHRRGRDGQAHGGHPFNKTTLYKILNNRIYLGEIRHKEKWYHGEHQAIVDQELWDKAHCIMTRDRTHRSADSRRKTLAPLKGLLYGPDGKAMTLTHTQRGDKQYRYYVT
ncbi:MAG: recombinase family protein, partial [Candidatus Thiodiazotropha sp.]